MRWPTLPEVTRQGRGALQRLRRSLRPMVRRARPGTFQPYNFTQPDRYPWLFGFAADQLRDRLVPRLLSFGCSRGEEAVSLRRYFPTALITGLDVDPRNIRACRRHASARDDRNISFDVAADTHRLPDSAFDAIFCLAVLCHGDLTTRGAQRCDPHLFFERFEAHVADFARCLRPGGLLFLHTTNFRFGDTSSAAAFTTILHAQPEQLAPDVKFDRTNRLMPGEIYLPVGFRKSLQS